MINDHHDVRVASHFHMSRSKNTRKKQNFLLSIFFIKFSNFDEKTNPRLWQQKRSQRRFSRWFFLESPEMVTLSVLRRNYGRIPNSELSKSVFEIIKNLENYAWRFRVILGVNSAADRNSSIEPTMVALDFKTVFTNNSIKVTTNWKTDTGWQQEEVIDSDWIDSKGSEWNFKCTVKICINCGSLLQMLI